VAPAFLGGENLFAQTQAPQTTNPVQQQRSTDKPDRTRRRAALHSDAASAQRTTPPETITEAPLASPIPNWPANQPPNHARVIWDSHGLKIEASNSSLAQILREVAADTGAKVEGFIPDQRIFGSYGPGPGCDVLSQLLAGSGYNVVMTGSRNGETPLEIVLSVRLPVTPQTVASRQNQQSSEDYRASEPLKPEPPPDYSAQTLAPQQNQNPFANGEAPHDPMQFMQEILQRQQRIDEQQQQQSQQNSFQQ
jgi:hypothetical protein